MQNAAEDPTGGWKELFRPVPLPRGRAVLTVVFAGAALLAAGGMLEFGSGSPATQATAAGSYWAVFSGLNLLAFGGAALLGGFPRLAIRPIKAVWAVALLALYGVAFSIWYHHMPGGAGSVFSRWASHFPPYVPAALAALAGLLWGELNDEGPEEAQR
jgi:hypothetical protein